MAIWILLISPFSCTQPDSGPATNDQVLTDILVDLFIADIAVNKNPKQLQDSMRKVYYSQLCKIHKLKEGELDSLVKNLQRDIVEYQRIGEIVLDKLHSLEESYNNERIKD